MFLGRIITKSKNIDTIEFVDVTSDKELAKNPSIPTLVIGKKNIEDIAGKENVHYLNKKVSDNLYWTFAKTEQRNEYERDLKAFNKMLLNQLTNSVVYKYLNIFTEPLSKIKRFITFIEHGGQKIVYISSNMLYIYSKKTVYGVSLSDLNYAGIKRNKVLAKIKQNPNNTIIVNDYFLTKNIKRAINGNKMLVPYVFFLENV